MQLKTANQAVDMTQGDFCEMKGTTSMQRTVS